MNGFELCKKIKSDTQYGNMPVIAVTSLAGDEHVQEGIRCGIDDYQVKLDRDKMLSSVARYVKSEITKGKLRSNVQGELATGGVR